MRDYGGNLPKFQKSCLCGGHFNPLVDFDGISRRVPMLAEYNGAYYESLSLAMVRALLGYPKVVPGFRKTAGSSSRGYRAWNGLICPQRGAPCDSR